MSSNDDAIRRAALERFNLDVENTDYNLQRVLRVAALALRCKYAAFSVRLADKQHYVAVHDIQWGDTLAGDESICHVVATTGQALWADDLTQLAEWQNHPAVASDNGIRAYIGSPVFASTKVPIGTFSVLSDEPLALDNEANRLIINDCVRLIEDSLLMRKDAVRDQLTGLFNRRYFQHQIEAEWRRAMRMQLPITMMILDIDHFKSLNDTAGHLAGDKAIRAVGQTLARVISRAGDVVCRFGGEEFAIILPTTSQAAAGPLAERIRSALYQEAIPHPGRPGNIERVTISIGAATVSSHTDLLNYSANEVLAEADSALYEAKMAGRDCFRRKILPGESETAPEA